jgi:ATP-binding protein involved in chromosome partitioning
MSLREQADGGLPVVLANPADAAAQAIVAIAQRVIALTPVALPMMAAEPPEPLVVTPPKPAGMSLPMA